MISESVLTKLEFLKILNYISGYTSTEAGKDNLLKLKPLEDLSEIKKEGMRVNEAKEILIKEDSHPIDYLSDLNEAISKSKIEGSVLSGKIILQILKLLVTSRLLAAFISKHSDIAPELNKLRGELYSDKLLEAAVNRIINDQGEVKDNASSKLSSIKKDIRSRKDDLQKMINRIMKSMKEEDFVQEDYLTLRDGRLVLPVKVEHKRHIKGFIHSESSTGQTVYIEPEQTLELNNEIVSLSFAERREVERLLRELTKKIGEHSPDLKRSLQTISIFDSVFARAKYSLETISSFPETDETKKFTVMNARHPLLIKKLGRNNVVPLSVELDDEKVIVITGPNAGGKTVVLKTIGLLAIMFQSGIHIPVDPDSNFHFLSSVLIDIGDEQSIEDDLSTFSSHMKNLFYILENADENSLVLLDEIGTGTDPTEGSALAAAILLELRDRGSLVFASTHHGNLKLVAHESNGMQNAAMQFDQQTLSPTYYFKLGMPGSSYAFEIARRTGFQDAIINSAKNNLDPEKYELEKFLNELETKSSAVQKQLRELELENTRLKGLSNLYKKSHEKLEKEKKDILKRTKSDAENYISEANKKIEKVIKELRETKADKKTITEAKEIVTEIRSKNEELFEDKPDDIEPSGELTEGDFVAIKNSQTSGKIVSIDQDKKKAVIESGSLRIVVKLSDLVKSKNKTENETIREYVNYSALSPEIRIDIRGKKPEEAEFEIVKFIDDAYSGNVNRIEILHGKGTGALKQTVREILKKHENVKSFYFAPVEQGGDGITIAEIE